MTTKSPKSNILSKHNWLIISSLALALMIQSASGMGGKGAPPQASGGQDNQPSTAAKAAETTGQVAGHSGTGETMNKITDYADARGAVSQGMSNKALKKHAETFGDGARLSSKNGTLGAYKKKALGQASKWQKLGKILKSAGKAIDIVSPVSRILGHASAGDWSGAGFATADEAGKKGATWGGGTAGTAVGGPVGGIIGAAGAEEVYTANVTPIIEGQAQNYTTNQTMTSQYTPENYKRYQEMEKMKTKLSPSEYQKWLQTQKKLTQQAAQTAATTGRVVSPKRTCVCP